MWRGGKEGRGEPRRGRFRVAAVVVERSRLIRVKAEVKGKG